MATGKKYGGRKAGTTNKITRAFKEAVLAVYNRMGEHAKMSGEDALLLWAMENQTEFYKIAARLIPHEVLGPGENGEHVIKTIIHQQLP